MRRHWRLRRFVYFLFFMVIFLLFLVLLLLFSILLVVFFILLIVFLFFIIFFPNPQLFLNLFNQSYNLSLRYFCFFQDVGMLLIKLFCDLLSIGIENKPLKDNSIYLFLLVSLLILVMDSNYGRLISHAKPLL